MTGLYDLAGRTCIVTGAASGIGRATSELLHRRGARVILTDLDADRVAQAAADLGGAERGAMAIAADTSDSDAVQKLVDAAVELSGGIDVIVPCAGIFRRSLVEETPDDAWDQVMSVNLRGVFRLIRSAIPYLTPTASIVTVASLAAHRGSHAEAAYAASKSGVVSLTMSLARELGPRGIRVNAVSPGLIRTTMTEDFIQTEGERVLAETPLRRFGTAAEVAEVIAFLASDAAGYVTGTHVHVNGGSFMTA